MHLPCLPRLSGSRADQFPPPAAIVSLSQEPCASLLVSLLLRAKTPIFGRVLDVLTLVVTADRRALTMLHRSGVFEILLWKTLAGDVTDYDRQSIARFLALTHLAQSPDALKHVTGSDRKTSLSTLPWQDSILRLYLPAGLIGLLIKEGSEPFAAALHQTLDTPEVVWQPSMKERLTAHLTEVLTPYANQRAENPLLPYKSVRARAPLEYHELENKVYCAPLYLHNLLDFAKGAAYEILDATPFAGSIMEELRLVPKNTDESGGAMWRDQVPRVLLLLKALVSGFDAFRSWNMLVV